MNTNKQFLDDSVTCYLTPRQALVKHCNLILIKLKRYQKISRSINPVTSIDNESQLFKKLRVTSKLFNPIILN